MSKKGTQIYGKDNPAFELSDEHEHPESRNATDDETNVFHDEIVYANFTEISKQHELENIDRRFVNKIRTYF